jgi:uncharacterized protein (TIGR01777 family)
MREARLRFGIVLAPQGGVLGALMPLFRMGLGARLGSGRQWMSWIALEDAIGAILHVLEHPELSGPVNLTAPAPVRNAEFTKALGRALHRPTVLWAPAFALRLALGGSAADQLLLASARVEPAKLLASGYWFRHPELDGALHAVLKAR